MISTMSGIGWAARYMRIRDIFSIIPLIALLGCTSRTDRSTAIHRDSAGISITESAAPQWSEEEEWGIDGEPFLDLSTSGTGPDHEFFRVSDAKLLPNGRIVVANAGTNEVRMYSTEGALLGSIGREGEGPGEFKRILGLVRLRGDSIGVWEYGGRVTLLGGEFQVGRLLSLPRAIGKLRSLEDSTLIGEITYPSVVVHEGGSGLIREPVPVVRLSLRGRTVDTLAMAAGYEEFMWTDPDHGGGAVPLFGKISQLATWGSKIYMGSADRMEFEVLSSVGKVQRIIRIPEFDLSLSGQEIQAEREGRLRPDVPAWYRDLINALPTPNARPAFSDIRIDQQGFAWLELFRGRTELDTDGTWLVFSPEGEWMGSLTVPAGFRVLDIGVSELLGVQVDTLGVEHVQLLRLHRE